MTYVFFYGIFKQKQHNLFFNTYIHIIYLQLRIHFSLSNIEIRTYQLSPYDVIAKDSVWLVVQLLKENKFSIDLFVFFSLSSNKNFHHKKKTENNKLILFIIVSSTLFH